MEKISITQIPGSQVGHAQNLETAAGCTIVICERGTVVGVDVRGGSPGMRETSTLDLVDNKKEAHAVLLASGNASGLDAAGGVMRYPGRHHISRDVEVMCIPNVSGAILSNLECGNTMVRPDAEAGCLACRSAGVLPLEEGSVGTSTGCTVGKTLGETHAMRGGTGTCTFRQGDLMVGVVITVNCVEDICNREFGRILAGVLQGGRPSPGGSEGIIVPFYQNTAGSFSKSTMIGCVITNAKLEEAQAKKLASISHNGIAKAVHPIHSVFDDDTPFTLCSGEVAASFDAAGILSAYTVGQAILQAAKETTSLSGYPSYQDVFIEFY